MRNPNQGVRQELIETGSPIDLYIGGITHATGHLIYFRFFHKFLYDMDLLKTIEPARVQRRRCRGGGTRPPDSGSAVHAADE